MNSLSRFTCAVIVLALAQAALGATIRVPEEYPTIQAGIAAASALDTVLVAPGTYTGAGNRDIDFMGKRITVKSEAGPEATLIDAEYLGRGFYFHMAETNSSTLDGFTIQHGGYPPDPLFNGGAVLVASAPTIRNCVMRENTARFGGGGMFFSSSTPRLIGCTFEDNTGRDGGALFVTGRLTVQDCFFIDNHASAYGGALVTEAATPTFITCVFMGNTAFSGAAIHCSAGYPSTALTLNNCTLAANSSNEGAAIQVSSNAGALVIRTIIALNGVASVFCTNGAIDLTCCDIYGNVGGNYVACIQAENGFNGNVSLDPRFCSLPIRDVRLHADSPCTPENSPRGCGLVGALPVACGASAVNPTTWGRLKSTYRR